MKYLVFFLTTLLLAGLAKAQDELPAISANRNTFFIPQKFIKQYNLDEAKGDDWMKVYNNFKEDAVVQRLNDIRWEAKTKQEAQDWFNANSKLLGEGGIDITMQLEKPKSVDLWKVYIPSKESSELFKAMGISQKQYNFTFTIDKYVAKIFVATNEKQSLKDAWKLAQEGVAASLAAAGKSAK